MYLVAPEKLLSSLTIQVSPGGLRAAKDALGASFSSVEAMVESNLTRKTTKDTFFCAQSLHYPTLRLTHAFLTDDPVGIVIDGQPLDPSTYYVNKFNGTVALMFILRSTARRTTVEVTYTHGYTHEQPEPAPEGPEASESGEEGQGSTQTPPPAREIDTELLVGVPGILSEMHLLLAASAMQIAPTHVPKDKAKAVGIDASRAFENKARILARSLDRPRGLTCWPDVTE